MCLKLSQVVSVQWGINLQTLWQFGRLRPYVNTKIMQSVWDACICWLNCPCCCHPCKHSYNTHVHTSHIHEQTQRSHSVWLNMTSLPDTVTELANSISVELIKQMWQEVNVGIQLEHHKERVLGKTTTNTWTKHYCTITAQSNSNLSTFSFNQIHIYV